MTIWTMMIQEIAYRKMNFLLGLAGVSGAVGLLIDVLVCLELHAAHSEAIVSRKQEDTETVMATLKSDVRKAMNRLGYNAVILPKNQPLGDWYAQDYASQTMPESWASRLAETTGLLDRYLPRLRQRIMWEQRKWTVIVVGIGEEQVLDASVCEDVRLVEPIPRQGCIVGYELHNALGLEAGEKITILGGTLQVAKCGRELGTKDDITIWMNLADLQELVNKPGLINEIMLVEHLSVWGDVVEVRRQIADVLPDCQVVEVASETLARAHARIKIAEEAKATIQREKEKIALLRAERRNTMMKVEGVTKTYLGNNKNVTAVDAISLSIQAREAIAVQGPSGCGKTTLLLMCGALLRPTTGLVSLDGVDPYGLSPNQRSVFRAKNIGFVFQQFHLVPYLDVFQNILAVSIPNKQPDAEERADELIEHFGLKDRIPHVPAELSVGEKQRVALARALFNKPKLVLADEPTGNLDPRNAVIVLDSLREYAEDGGAVLMVTHDPKAAKRAHRVVLMDEGHLVDGP